MNRLMTRFNCAPRIALVWFVLLIAGCQTEMPLPTRANIVATVDLSLASETGGAVALAVPPTWTAVPLNFATSPTTAPTGGPRATATPSATFPPSKTPTGTPTSTATAVPPSETPTDTPAATATRDPNNLVWGGNLLPNGSFEDGDYLQGGQPELQLPSGWSFEYDEGPTNYGTEIWDVYLRPEVRVLSERFLPAHEHALFIWDGVHTVKAFKGNGAISFRLFREVYLEPGVYQLEINVFPDLVMGWNGDQKIWADDPLSGEVRFIAPGAGEWMLPLFGRKNSFTYQFTLTEAQTVRLGAAIRGNFAIANDGWFLDDWSLRRAEN